jgi:hypothetical protein
MPSDSLSRPYYVISGTHSCGTYSHCFVVVYVTKLVVNLFIFRVCRAATLELRTLSLAHALLSFYRPGF